MVNPIIVALDFPTLAEAEAMAGRLADEVGGFKVGMELLMSAGPTAIGTIAALWLYWLRPYPQNARLRLFETV